MAYAHTKSFLSHVWLFATLWAVDLQVPLSVRFSTPEYWSGLSCPPPENLPDPGIEPTSLMFTELAGGSLQLVPTGKPLHNAAII